MKIERERTFILPDGNVVSLHEYFVWLGKRLGEIAEDLK